MHQLPLLAIAFRRYPWLPAARPRWALKRRRRLTDCCLSGGGIARAPASVISRLAAIGPRFFDGAACPFPSPKIMATKQLSGRQETWLRRNDSAIPAGLLLRSSAHALLEINKESPQAATCDKGISEYNYDDTV